MRVIRQHRVGYGVRTENGRDRGATPRDVHMLTVMLGRCYVWDVASRTRDNGRYRSWQTEAGASALLGPLKPTGFGWQVPGLPRCGCLPRGSSGLGQVPG